MGMYIFLAPSKEKHLNFSITLLEIRQKRNES